MKKHYLENILFFTEFRTIHAFGHKKYLLLHFEKYEKTKVKKMFHDVFFVLYCVPKLSIF